MLWFAGGFADRHIRSYLLDHPELLPAMVENLQHREAQSRLQSIRDDVATPFPGAVLGNPNGSRVLVEFTDYACGYCKASVADVARLVAADPELKVVIREWAIFPGSEEAARWALAAARQGRFAAFHDAMFAAGRVDDASIAAAARAAGLDLDAARLALRSPEIEQELERTRAFAAQLGFTGTPSWVAGDQLIQGAVGERALAAALAGTRTAAR
ncbi:DsbA family protein [Erythrobacteraceae bacterium CFH 75059]|nr:DsbA family protein [Erythrobacteraceae bacterium CFH 75059]